MKHKFLLSVLTAIVFLAATTTADAGIFGRLSTVWNGCNPCLPVACMPCEPVACNPCDAICWDPCGPFVARPFRPFGGLFANMGARLAAARMCDPCGPIVCDPCAPVVCNPCDPVACDPCAPICGPGVRLPFNGFFLNLGSRFSARGCAIACDPCAPIVCNPCDPIACDPCAPRFFGRW